MFRSTKCGSLNLLLVLLILLCSTNVLGSEEYQKLSLKLHNEYRKKHAGTPDLVAVSYLESNAVKCANHYVQIGTIDHSCPYKADAGENLLMSPAKLDVLKATKDAVDLWYGEIKDYDFALNKEKAGKGFGNIGHFTQAVWKGSTEHGAGAVSTDRGTFVVGLYNPPGNYRDKYKENVLPLASRAESGAETRTANGTSVSHLLGSGQNCHLILAASVITAVRLVASEI